jgi:hypothetical protein
MCCIGHKAAIVVVEEEVPSVEELVTDFHQLHEYS